MILRFDEHRLQLVLGDITQQVSEILVNAANSELIVGGGVDGAIHRAAGPELIVEIRRRFPQGCPVGDCVPTSAGRLPAKYLLHAVGPVWRGGHRGEPELLRSAYRKCLQQAGQLGCHTIAFPSLSTGVYGYPVDLAAETSLAAIIEFLQEQPALPGWEIRMVLFDRGTFAAYSRVMESHIKN